MEVDLMGPFVKSTNGNTFGVTAVVRDLRYKYFVPIKSKDEAPLAVKKILEDIETDSRYFQHKLLGGKHPITHIYSDSESSFSFTLSSYGWMTVDANEVASSEKLVKGYQKIVKSFGIQPVVNSVYTSSFSGLVENTNRQIRRTANAMMYSASLSPVWWDDAMTWAVQLLNIRPSTTLWISEADIEESERKKT